MDRAYSRQNRRSIGWALRAGLGMVILSSAVGGIVASICHVPFHGTFLEYYTCLPLGAITAVYYGLTR